MEYGKGGSTTISDTPAPTGALKKSNIFYALIFLLVAIICFIFYNKGGGWDWLKKLFSLAGNVQKLAGLSAVLRITAGMAIWFAIHGLMTIGTPDFENSTQFMLHSSFLAIHVILLILLIVLAFLLPEEFIEFWTYFAMVLSGIYLVFQALMLIIWFDQINNEIGKEENLTLGYVITSVLGVATLGGWIICFLWFVQSNCTNNVPLILINIIAGCLLFIIGWFSEHGSGLVSIVVIVYALYNLLCGLMCSTQCYPSERNLTFTIVGSVFTIAWMTYSAFSASNNLKYFDCCSDEDTSQEDKFSLPFFHFCFSLASIYLGMLVSNWGQVEDSVQWGTNRGTVARWVNIVVSWIVVLFYSWIIIAPAVCKGRSFDY